MNIFTLSSYFTSKFLMNEDSKQPSTYFNDYGFWKNINLPNHKMYAYINVPKSPTECVMYLHGHRVNRKEALNLSELFNKLNPNFMYIIPEYRGFGESDETFDKNEINDDLLKWLKFIIKKYNVNKFRIAGHSLGAAIASSLFKYLNDQNFFNNNVKLIRLVLISTFTDTTSVAKSIVQKYSGFNLYFIMKCIIPDNVNYDLNKIFESTFDKSNIIVIHGKKDDICDFELTHEMCRKFGLNLVSIDSDHVDVLNNQITYNHVHI
ncbi:hydrolase with alpha beta fold protein [Vairimorpha apis BRL 01]|uniref:Hydrolase with alpha beta fold protein n=2 Tax=Vairimorpha apis BRL 01 TaxID=1037528 RepID=T0MDT4_9MICR|nr:hydrolase with alpha beta fold protein [Vairimorpha apis BRL 01]